MSHWQSVLSQTWDRLLLQLQTKQDTADFKILLHHAEVWLWMQMKLGNKVCFFYSVPKMPLPVEIPSSHRLPILCARDLSSRFMQHFL